jgi:hypothetical protein
LGNAKILPEIPNPIASPVSAVMPAIPSLDSPVAKPASAALRKRREQVQARGRPHTRELLRPVVRRFLFTCFSGEREATSFVASFK